MMIRTVEIEPIEHTVKVLCDRTTKRHWSACPKKKKDSLVFFFE